MLNELANSYANGDVILFVGAGVSANLGLPTWKGLIEEIGIQLDFDPDVFMTYGDSLALAEYYKIVKGNIGPLRSWMDRKWHPSTIDITKSKVHEIIAKGNFPIVYTTNYDRWLELAYTSYFQDFKKIITVNDLVSLDPSLKQIVKYHGDFDDDNSIVLAESDYYDRLQFETPLDIKLRADVLGKTVLFIGYSLNDINIRLLFYKLTKMWSLHGLQSARPKSYLFSARPNPIQKTILETRGIHLLASDDPHPGNALVDFLTNLNSMAGIT